MPDMSGRWHRLLAWTFAAALGVGLGCSRASKEPSPEFRAAMQLYEDTVSQTLDPTYQHPDFGRVAALLAQVPADNEREHRTATRLLESIQAAQAEVKAREASLESAREAAATAPSPEASGLPSSGSLEWRPGAPMPTRETRPASGSDANQASFDRAAERARAQNLARERSETLKKQRTHDAEVRAKMRERLREKMDERMNTPLDEVQWKVEQTNKGTRITTSVEVKRDEVE